MKKLFFESYFEKIKLKKGDNILVCSNLLKILILKKRYSFNFNPNDILDALISVVGTTGTILIPTYNWDFCRGLGFNYKKTPSNSGTLGNFALKRSDFERTKHPIYSFAVYGKKKRYLTSLKNKNCFSKSSPFGHLIKNNGKNVFIDINDIYIDAFTFMHVAEQEVGIDYRFIKIFSGKYVHKNIKNNKAKFKMYVRKLDEKIKRISPNIKNILIKENAYIEKICDRIKFISIKLSIAHRIIKNDLQNEKKLIVEE